MGDYEFVLRAVASGSDSDEAWNSFMELIQNPSFVENATEVNLISEPD